MWLLTLLLLGVLLLLAFLDAKKPPRFPPGPTWLPLLGSLLYVQWLISRCNKLHFMAWYHLSKLYGPVVGLRLGRQLLIIISGRDAVMRSLLNEDLDGRPDGFAFRHRTMGIRRGIIFTDGDPWKEQRRFCLSHLRDLGFGRQSMETQIQEEAAELSRQLRESSGPVAMRRAFTVPVLNALWCLTAGSRYDPALATFVACLEQLTRSVDTSGGLLTHLPVIRHLAPRASGFQEFDQAQRKMWEFFKDIVNKHRKTLPLDYDRDLIDIYLHQMEKDGNLLGSLFAEEQLIALVKDLFAAGSETTSNTLAFCVLHILRNPKVQRRAQQEIDAVLGRDKTPSLVDKPRLPYVNAFLLEVQRVSHVGAMTLPHRALAASEVEGYVVPKDATLLMSLHSVHMDPEHWGDPDNFRPERFLDKDGCFHPDTWVIPFGAGRRRCLGDSLARNTLFLFVVTLLQSLSFELPPGEAAPPASGLGGFTNSPQPFNAIVVQRN